MYQRKDRILVYCTMKVSPWLYLYYEVTNMIFSFCVKNCWVLFSWVFDFYIKILHFVQDLFGVFVRDMLLIQYALYIIYIYIYINMYHYYYYRAVFIIICSIWYTSLSIIIEFSCRDDSGVYLLDTDNKYQEDW